MDARFVGIAESAKAPSVAVVIDVMRAFTAAAWAFARGAAPEDSLMVLRPLAVPAG